MNAPLKTHSFGREYYEEHKAAGLDYLGHGDWQRRYGQWLSDVFGWRELPTLDIGCACGSILKGFVDAGRTDMVGIDLSEAMIQLGRQKWPTLAGRLHIGDAQSMPFGDSQFDGLHSAQVAEHWKPETVPGILAECYRVLRRGGVFFCCMDTAELYARQHRDAATEDPTHWCIKPMAWWRDAFKAAGFRDKTKYFDKSLRAHPKSMLDGGREEPTYDWDYVVMQRPSRS